MRSSTGATLVSLLLACGSAPADPVYDAGRIDSAPPVDARQLDDASGVDAFGGDDGQVDDASMPPDAEPQCTVHDTDAWLRRLFPPSGLNSVGLRQNHTPPTRQDTSIWGTDDSDDDLSQYESDVFRTRLQSESGWEVGVGKGTQIYSLLAPDGRELIPPQRDDARWIDEVIQTVAVDRCQDRVGRDLLSEMQEGGMVVHELYEPLLHQIHQAGVYRRHSVLAPEEPSFYSPVFAEDWNATEGTYSTLSWSQQAHVPTFRTSDVLLAQQLRDVGENTLEVTVVVMNHGPQQIDFLASPTVSLRNSTLPIQLRSNPDGTLQRLDHDWPPPDEQSLSDGGGFFIAAEPPAAPERMAVGIVFGHPSELPAREVCVGDPRRLGNGYRLRHGRVGGGRNITLVVVQRPVPLGQREAFWFRYYLVIGPLQQVTSRSRELVQHADSGSYQPRGARLDVCNNSSATCDGETYTMAAEPLPSHVPFFEIMRGDAETAITHVIRRFSPVSTQTYPGPAPDGLMDFEREPYRAADVGYRMLGWGRQSDATPCTNEVELARVFRGPELIDNPTNTRTRVQVGCEAPMCP